MDRRRRLAVAAVGAPVLATVVLLLVMKLGTVEHPHSKTAGPTSPAGIRIDNSAPPLTPARAKQISGELSTGTDDGLRSAIALPSGQALDPAAAAQIKALGAISVDPATFHRNPDGSATVAIHIQSPPPGQTATWTATLINVNGQWKITFTDPAS